MYIFIMYIHADIYWLCVFVFIYAHSVCTLARTYLTLTYLLPPRMGSMATNRQMSGVDTKQGSDNHD